jgi:methylmalonyl-CoA/ethylmalonyl-CoA epimerase
MQTFPDGERVAHISFVTDDLEASTRWFAELFGKPLPESAQSGDPEIVRATYRGAPTAASFRMRTFHLANIDIEFLEPGPEPSIWREFLDRHGPGFHHLSFATRDRSASDAYLRGKGLAVAQEGDTAEVPGHYAYYDAQRQLGAFIELLELREPD